MKKIFITAFFVVIACSFATATIGANNVNICSSKISRLNIIAEEDPAPNPEPATVVGPEPTPEPYFPPDP
jgi:hypothetical protein